MDKDGQLGTFKMATKIASIVSRKYNFLVMSLQSYVKCSFLGSLLTALSMFKS